MAVTLGGMTLLTDNDSGTGWAGTDGIDTYGFSIQGANSESWQLSKNATETGTLTASASMPASRGIYTVWIASSIQAIYSSIDLTLQSTAGNSRAYSIATSASQNVDGAFKAFAFDYVNKGTPTGTFNPASLTSSIFTIVTQNINFRAVPNNWIDTIHYGAGHTIAGTTTGDKLFTEAVSADIAGDFYYGIIENYNSKIFSQGDISLTGTALTSNGESLVFIETANGYDTYEFGGTGTATFVNTSIEAAGIVRFNMDMSSMTAFSMTGGNLVRINTLTLSDGQTLSGVVLTNLLTATINNTPTDCTFNSAGLLTLGTTGTLSNCTHITPTGTSAVSTTALSKLVTNRFTSDGTGHAITLTDLGAGSMTWDSIATGYTAGTTGSPVTPTSTGNEALYVNVGAGTITVNIATGATVPSIRSAGATVNVVAGLSSLNFTVSPSITGYEYRVYTVTALGSLAGATEVQGEESATVDNQSYSYTYSAGVKYAIQILPKANDYEESITYYSASATDQNIIINLKTDINN